MLQTAFCWATHVLIIVLITSITTSPGFACHASFLAKLVKEVGTSVRVVIQLHLSICFSQTDVLKRVPKMCLFSVKVNAKLVQITAIHAWQSLTHVQPVVVNFTWISLIWGVLRSAQWWSLWQLKQLYRWTSDKSWPANNAKLIAWHVAPPTHSLALNAVKACSWWKTPKLV